MLGPRLDTLVAGTTATDGGTSTARKVLQGAIVFVVMFVLLWWMLSRMTADER